MEKNWLFVIALLGLSYPLGAQTEPEGVEEFLKRRLQASEVVSHELLRYASGRIPELPGVSSAREWTQKAEELRNKMLEEIVFHGWPQEWVDARPKFEDLGLISSGDGYRLRKLRYEIVPGFYSAAILYEPESSEGKIPAILNVNGHSREGKALEYKQKRCIQQARSGILALNLEWIGMGELRHNENSHSYGAHLDLAGANSLGLFYLAMRRGLDYLYEHPRVDRSRIGMTGLSGGAWQTILLSSLDERVGVAVPVAGFGAVISRIERPSDVGDIEQNATDMLTLGDYSHLTAIRAPRPTLLVYNAEDDCCFRGPLVKPYVYDRIRPFFDLYDGDDGKDRFAWHLNTDPSDHNYALDNRQHAYRFFSKHLGVPIPEAEADVARAIKSYEELEVGLPENNLTILGVAKRLAGRIQRSGIPSDGSAGREWAANERAKLKSLVRFDPVAVERAWAVGNSHRKGLETRAYRFSFSNGLSATAVRLHALPAADAPAGTLIVHDGGKKMSADAVSERVNRGEQVLAVDLLFSGDSAPERPGPQAYAQLLATLGQRALGMEAAQLTALASWMRQELGVSSVRLESFGIRSQVISLVAAALEPNLFSEIVVRDGMGSLGHLLDAGGVEYKQAPDLFCLDLYKEFDLDRLARIAGPTKVTTILVEPSVQ